jgi:hypothetical protein
MTQHPVVPDQVSTTLPKPSPAPIQDASPETIPASHSLAPSPAPVLENHPIDELPPIKVIVVGAGVSGITAGILLPEKVPGIDLTIYDRNSDLVNDNYCAFR